jgi:hypothetical protein
MNASAPVPDDHPLMIAWKSYQATEDYANSYKWATAAIELAVIPPPKDPTANRMTKDGYRRFVEGSLWAAFMAGFNTRAPSVDSGVLEGGRGGDGIHPNEPGLPKLNVPVNFPYFATFRAIAFAVEVGAAKMLHISVEKFQQEFNRQFALAPGETPAALPVADARNEGIEEALKFYADPETWKEKHRESDGQGGVMGPKLALWAWDYGKKAREALALKSPPAEGGK